MESEKGDVMISKAFVIEEGVVHINCIWLWCFADCLCGI